MKAPKIVITPSSKQKKTSMIDHRDHHNKSQTTLILAQKGNLQRATAQEQLVTNFMLNNGSHNHMADEQQKPMLSLRRLAEVRLNKNIVLDEDVDIYEREQDDGNRRQMKQLTTAGDEIGLSQHNRLSN